MPNKLSRDLFGGGAGAGVSIKPEGFIVINDGDVQMIHALPDSDPISRIINNAPNLVNKLSDVFSKKKKKDDVEIIDDSDEFDG